MDRNSFCGIVRNRIGVVEQNSYNLNNFQKPMMDSNVQTRELLSQQIKNEFECDIIYEPIKREIVEEDSSKIELDHDQSDSEDDVFYENETKLMEKTPSKSHEFTDEIFESDTGFIYDKNYNSSCKAENMLTKSNLMSDSSGLDSDLKNALENPTYQVDCDQKEGVLIMNMINEKFSLGSEHSSSNSKNSSTDKVECKREIEDDIEIVYDDVIWEDSSENKAKVNSEVCKQSNETYLNNSKSDMIGCQGQNKVNLDSTDNVMQSENSPEEKMSCSSIETTKESAVVPVFHGDMVEITVINRNLSSSKDEMKSLKVLLHRNFGLRNINQNNGGRSLICDLPLKLNHLKYPNSHQCELCSKSFLNRRCMLRHYRYHSQEKPQCAICSKYFYSKHYLLSHIRIIHKNDLSFQCKVCSKSFTRNCNLSRHERIHKRVNSYHCKVCPKSFFNKTVFKRHKKSHEEKLFNCSLCSRSFRNGSNLDKHMIDHDKNIKPFHCTLCPKSFSARALLATHERIHKGEKPFRCKYCPKSFADKSHLPVHERTHNGERPFLCKVCSKSFTQSSHLRIHEKIHIGEKPFRCKICSKCFIYKRALFVHQRVHKSKKERLRDDKYHCKFCSKSFQYRTTLNDHENTHAEEKPYRCSLCSKSYSCKRTLTRHERDRHKKTIKSKV